MTVFLATLGQRPESITMALDALIPRYHYDEIVILHTDEVYSGIVNAYHNLMRVLADDYPHIKSRGERLHHPDGRAIVDISDQYSAEAYYHAMLQVIRQYRIQYTNIHLMIAGGRKAMSIYAALAAGVLFGENDHLWTIHTPPHLMKTEQYHLPAGMQDQAKLIKLPIMPSRLLPGTLAQEDIPQLSKRIQTSPRQQFMDSLTDEETRLTEILRQHPYATNEELGDILAKSPRTVENQLREIYGKLFQHFGLTIEDKRKRHALVDVLSGRV